MNPHPSIIPLLALSLLAGEINQRRRPPEPSQTEKRKARSAQQARKRAKSRKDRK